MEITIIGPGRAGMALALAAHQGGHSIVAVVGHTAAQAHRPAESVAAVATGIDEAFDPGDLLVVATRDDVIEEVAADIAGRIPPRPGGGAVHLSGLVSVSALEPLAGAGYATGSFHPLQTIPTPEAGAAKLAGAWVGITGNELRPALENLAESLGMESFELADDTKALYHAAAAAAANFPLGSLAMSSDLFAAAGVPFEAARPLVEAIVANAFELGPRAALTGPVARGDVDTVAGQMAAVAAAEPTWLSDFVAEVRSLARISGTAPQMEEMIQRWKRPEGTE